MMEIIEKIRNISANNESYDDESILINDKGYNNKKADFKTIKNDDKNSRIAFVDGGNAEILSSSAFSLHLIRVYCCVYQGKKRTLSKKYEFWSLARPIINNNLSYEVEIIGNNDFFNQKIAFDPSDETLKEGVYDANISKFGSIIRRFAELAAADKIAKEMSADIIVLDGNLQHSYVGETTYLKDLINNCSKNNIKLAAISKTNSILTNKGRAASVLLNKTAPSGIWQCEIAERKSTDLPNICLAKLHQSSKHIFRVDLFDESVFDVLADHSKDPIFLGYPYGLIEADGFARVSNREKQLLKTMLMARLGNESSLVSALSNSDAHQILDRIQY